MNGRSSRAGHREDASDTGIGDDVKVLASSCTIIKVRSSGTTSRSVMPNCRLLPTYRQMIVMFSSWMTCIGKPKPGGIPEFMSLLYRQPPPN